MFFNILTAISLDAIGDMMVNASDDIILNKIDYFELKEFYNKHIMENQEDKKFRNWIGRIINEINEIIYFVQNFIFEKVYLSVREFWYKYLKINNNSKTHEEEDSAEENLNLAKSIENLKSMIKLLSNKVEINDREVKQELEDKFNRINDKIETSNNNEKENKENTKEMCKLKINEMDAKFNKMDEKLKEMDEKLNKKMDEKFEQVLMTLNQLNTKRGSSKSHSKSSRHDLDIANPKSKESEENDQSSKDQESVGFRNESNKREQKQREFQIDDRKDENKKYHDRIDNVSSKTDSGLPNRPLNNK